MRPSVAASATGTSGARANSRHAGSGGFGGASSSGARAADMPDTLPRPTRAPPAPVARKKAAPDDHPGPLSVAIVWRTYGTTTNGRQPVTNIATRPMTTSSPIRPSGLAHAGAETTSVVAPGAGRTL